MARRTSAFTRLYLNIDVIHSDLFAERVCFTTTEMISETVESSSYFHDMCWGILSSLKYVTSEDQLKVQLIFDKYLGLLEQEQGKIVLTPTCYSPLHP